MRPLPPLVHRNINYTHLPNMLLLQENVLILEFYE
jgi:hypothetical protein